MKKTTPRGQQTIPTDTVLDLFAGCGGLSLGFQSAGFALLGGVEADPIAAATHGTNFHHGSPHHGLPHKVEEAPHSVLRDLGHGEATQVGVLIGGPPCQAFARVGRAKLRSESARRRGHVDDRAWLLDPRVGLYERYLHFIDTLRPSALLMENVPDILNHGGINIAEEVCEELEHHGYEVAYALLNAVHFGVPQMRERMFLVGYRRDLKVGRIEWPEPTHHHELPRGYQGSRECALRPLRNLGSPDRESPSRYQPVVEAHDGLPPAITAAEALADLPPLHALDLLKHDRIGRGVRSLRDASAYRRDARTAYSQVMRNWPGFATNAATAHVIRYLPRDYRIFRQMRPGDQYPEAVRHARRLLARRLDALTNPPRPGTAAYRAIESAFVPPYDPGKFPNKWRKMEPDAPARTLMAHLGKDSYSHIHHDSAQARTISVREAARLQSFPDGFQFCGSMNAGFRQIGNAVPPLLAYALARQVRQQLALPQEMDFRRTFGLTSPSASGSVR